MEFLGFLVIWNGIRPRIKKVEALVNITPPNNKKQVRAFIGLVNYDRDIWSIRSHILHPLTELMSNNVELKWKDVEQKSFDYVKFIVNQDTLLEYPNFNECFNIHMCDINY